MPPDYISKTVCIEEDSGELLIYHAGVIVAAHGLATSRKSVVFDESHLREGIAARTGMAADSSRIDEYCAATMRGFKAMGGRADV